MAEPPLLAAIGLTKHFDRAGHAVTALDRVDIAVGAGEIVALAGASGSGKSTLARCLLRLIEPDAGTIRFAGTDLLAARGAALRAMRRRIQMVFQDPLAALNPRATVARTLTDPLRLHGLVRRGEREAEVRRLLAQVGLSATLLGRLPHELSGGQRQRLAIARAIACRPALIVLDEPVSSLDVSVRAHVMNLLLDLRAKTGVSYLLISHDLALVSAVAGRVAIMQAGRIVESGTVATVLATRIHAATRALLDAVPRLRIDRRHPT
jgi:peptide/nickel transport system ATP-binding protein